MLVLFLGIAAIVGTVALGYCCGDSWFHFWEGLGDTQRDDQGIFHT